MLEIKIAWSPRDKDNGRESIGWQIRRGKLIGG